MRIAVLMNNVVTHLEAVAILALVLVEIFSMAINCFSMNPITNLLNIIITHPSTVEKKKNLK